LSRGLVYKRRMARKAKKRTIRRMDHYWFGGWIKEQEAVDLGLLEGDTNRKWCTFRRWYPPDIANQLITKPWWECEAAKRDIGFYASWHGPRGCGHRRKGWGNREELPYADRKRLQASEMHLKDYRLCVEYCEPIDQFGWIADDYLALEEESAIMRDVEMMIEEMHDYLSHYDPTDHWYDEELDAAA
jgi:hypothetical protein